MLALFITNCLKVSLSTLVCQFCRGSLKGSGVFSQCRDKDSLDICWLRDESLEESDNLPDRDVLAQEIVEDREAALEQFREVARFSMAPTLYRKIRKLTND